MSGAGAQAGGTEVRREFAFTDADFRSISQLVTQKTGIRISDSKRHMVYSRLARRLRALGLPDFSSYLERVASDDSGEESTRLVNALTTNLTAFFREPHHFDYLANDYLPKRAAGAGRRRLRIWCAGCSSGEEPYSVAMTVAESLRDFEHWDVRVLATDLDSDMVARGKAGIYPESRVRRVGNEQLRRWFLRGTGRNTGHYRVKPELAKMVAFRQLNLLEAWPFRGRFDLIFCRNVVIYFDKTIQRRLFERFANVLVDDGRLFIGHSETLFKVSTRFRALGQTIYEKVE